MNYEHLNISNEIPRNAHHLRRRLHVDTCFLVKKLMFYYLVYRLEY